MKKPLTIVFICLFAVAEAVYSQTVVVQFSAPTLIPNPIPPCGSQPSTATQTATYAWTLECVSAGNHTGIASGMVSGMGTGACQGGLGGYCSGDPTFSPKYQVGSPNTSIYVAITSVTGTTTPNGGVTNVCNNESITQGTVVMTPTPNCSIVAGGCDCAKGYECCSGTCILNGSTCTSPIVLDAFNQGYHLTGLSDGVQFRLLPGGPLQQVSWTDANWQNGWLALDRNGNGTIDDFSELFGNLTAQPSSPDPNGFLALAVFDEPANGGNGNGFIDPGDAVYPHLRVWIDANHNGVSEPNELHSLQELGIFRIGLKYQLTPFVDEYGNRFRFKGSFWDERGNEKDLCYDVFLVSQSN